MSIAKIKRNKSHLTTTVNPTVVKMFPENKPQDKTLDGLNIQLHFRISTDTFACVHRPTSLWGSSCLEISPTMNDLPDKLHY